MQIPPQKKQSRNTPDFVLKHPLEASLVDFISPLVHIATHLRGQEWLAWEATGAWMHKSRHEAHKWTTRVNHILQKDMTNNVATSKIHNCFRYVLIWICSKSQHLTCFSGHRNRCGFRSLGNNKERMLNFVPKLLNLRKPPIIWSTSKHFEWALRCFNVSSRSHLKGWSIEIRPRRRLCYDHSWSGGT